ncbi:MAG: prepilin-type N-terminal cleavage/methylation domain-containing protein [Rubripirellula sp.]
MKRNKKSGFSLLEVIAAVVILAVVAAATVATVAPMRAKSEDKLKDQEIASLNAMSQTYYLEHGSFPSSAIDLGAQGYLPYRTAAEKTRVKEMTTKYRYTESRGEFRK